MMRVGFPLIFVLVFLLGVTSIAWAQEVPAPLKTATAEKVGAMLTAPNGMTLYIYARDTEPGKSTCTGGCAQNWPPFRPGLYDPAPKAPLSIITREDGSKQYAYKARPLYFWAHDKAPGETTGHKLGGAWFVAQP